jgi:hypothetical protein
MTEQIEASHPMKNVPADRDFRTLRTGGSFSINQRTDAATIRSGERN